MEGHNFPAHWGPPPQMQTKDLRPLPGEFGMGSSTLATWIQQHLDADAGAPPAPPAEDSADTQRDLMYGYTSLASFVEKRNCIGGQVFVFRLDSLTVTRNPDSSNAKWVTPVAEGQEHMIGLKDMHQHLAVAEALQPGARVQLDWNHDYVTVNGCSSPDRPVIALAPL